MMIKPFVRPGSIVRRIWGNSDTILFIFAGAAAEFAVNKAVDWLFYTGKLPADPLGRLFSTVGYAHQIIFAGEEDAIKAISTIVAIHAAVEDKRSQSIPSWAYRDVLYMLVDYSIRAFELLERPLARHEKEDVYEVFSRMGNQMGIPLLPHSFRDWIIDRKNHMDKDLAQSRYTEQLFTAYKHNLGGMRFHVMTLVQSALLPVQIREMVGLGKPIWSNYLIDIYCIFKSHSLAKKIRFHMLPISFRKSIAALDRHLPAQ